MSGGGPFDLGSGRNGPAASGVTMLGGGKRKPAPPYRIDLSDEDFQAVGDVVVCTLAPSRERKGSIELPDAPSPFHVALAVGPKVAEVLGMELEVGDVFAMEGAAFADTLAGRVWFCRADKILSVVTPRGVAGGAMDEHDAAAFAADRERIEKVPDGAA